MRIKFSISGENPNVLLIISASFFANISCIFLISSSYSSIFFAIDVYRLTIHKEPIFCINTITYRDGGSKEYLGIGYKIITYNSNNRQDFEVGTWFLKYN